MRSHRSKLKPYKRKAKDGKTFWTARGSIPERQPDGSFTRRRIEVCIGGDTAITRQAEADKLNAAYEDRALNVPLTFARAYQNYIEGGHAVPEFGETLVRSLGVHQCHAIDDTLMIDLRLKMFKAGAAASYVNRHLYTPVIAILNMALKELAPKLERPAGHKESPIANVPDEAWYRTVLPFMGPNTLALVSFLTMHGRRLGDALGRRPTDFHRKDETLIIERTKNGDPMFLELHPRVAQMIRHMPGWDKRRWLFGDGPTSGSNVRADVLVACCRASGIDKAKALKIATKPSEYRDVINRLSVPYFTPHELGRHAFARRMLRAGYSLQYVKDAGGWKSIEVLSKLYGHLERKEWTAGVHKVADTFIDANILGFGEKVGIALHAPSA